MGVSVDQSQKRNSRQLRQNMTDAEKKLWQSLRCRQLHAAKFRRQVVLGAFIVDFACMEFRLIVEVDGGQHNGCAQDNCRDAWLMSQGFRVLRFWNNEVLNNLEGVLEKIDCTLQATPPSNLPPSRGKAISPGTGLPFA